MLIGSLNDDMADAKVKALAACTKVEDIGSAMASMPHYLSVGVNALAADGISKAINAMVDILMMILTGVEQIILFVLNMYVGTYACLIAAFIHGGLDMGIGAADEATKVMNTAIGSITQSISNDIGTIQNAINSAFSGISDIAGAFGAKPSPPQIDISGHLNDLKNIKVDDTQFVKDLVSLNKTIPTFDQVENFTANAISIPFNLIKNALNSSYAGYAFDKSIFPVANKEALTFCSDNSFINDFFQTLFDIIAKAKIGFIVVLAILAILACVPMALLEIRRWRRQKRHAYVFTKHGYDSMDVVYIASRPMTATWGIKLASRFSGKRQLLVRWAFAYATSLPAIFVLSLAIAGLFSCLCQFIILRAIQQEAPVLAAQVGNFAEEVVTTLEGVSVKWANDANGVIVNFNNKINQDVLGYVTNATTAVNNTLNTFENDMNTALNSVFNGTVLNNVVQDVVRCLIGIKIDNLEKGLTWVHDHAKVTFPTFPNDTFSRGASDSIHGDSELTSFLATPASVTTDEITGAVEHVTNALHSNLVQEALTSTGLLLIFVIVILIGICRSLASMTVPDKTRGEGGQRYVTASEMNSADAGAGTALLTGEGRRPMSPRTAAAAEKAQFPEFGEDTEYYGARDEKVSPFAGSSSGNEKTSRVRGGKAGLMRNASHWRSSSHGSVEDVGR
jgi:hypothetical protein